MRRNHAFLFALLLAGCDWSRAERSAELAGTVWVSPLFPDVVDTLAFNREGTFRWYSAEVKLTKTGTYRRSGDTLFLDEIEDEHPTEEERAQGPGLYQLVVRDTTLELIFAQHGTEPPITEFEPSYVFTPGPSPGQAAPR